jgi:hypothetical protein
MENNCAIFPFWLSDNDYFPADTPVEIKGYKNILDLPDWMNEHGIPAKSQKPCQNS